MTTCLVTAAIPRTIDLFLGPHMRRLGELGFKVHIASSGTPKVAVEQQLPCHRVEFSRSPFNLLAHYRAWRAYRQLLDELTADGEPVVLHLHTPIAAALARLAVRRSHPARVLYMAHGFHFLPGERNLYYWIERALAHLTDLFVLINEDDLHSAKTLCGGDDSRVCKIPGVGLQRTGRSHRGRHLRMLPSPSRESRNTAFPTPRRKIIVVGVLEPRKHPELAVRAAALLDETVDVHMIGDGPLEAELRELANTLGCGHRVHFEGWTDEVGQWFATADCLMFLSEREGLPMTVAESLAENVPVVAFDIRGVRDLLGGLIGWHIPQARTPEAVAAAVGQALGGRIDTAAWRRRAREFSLDASLAAHDTAITHLALGLADHTVGNQRPAIALAQRLNGRSYVAGSPPTGPRSVYSEAPGGSIVVRLSERGTAGSRQCRTRTAEHRAAAVGSDPMPSRTPGTVETPAVPQAGAKSCERQ